MFSFASPGLSYVRGLDPEGPLVDWTIHEAFLRAERDEGCCKTFIVSVHQERCLTYGQVGILARAFAANLLGRLGFRRGDRLGIWLPNRFEYIVALVGCSMAGVVLTTMNPAYRASELHHAATLIGIKGLVMQARVKSSDYHAILKEAGNIHSLDWVIEVGESVRPTSVPFNDLLVAPPGGYFVIDESASCRDAANIQFTSGTTGSPKGAVLSHYNIVNNAMSFGRRLMISDRDVLVIPLPLYHCFGLNLGVVTTICCRATIVLPSESFDANATLNAIANQRGTLVYGVPTMLLELHLAHTAKGAPVRDIFALRGGGIGGSPCPPELMQKLIRDLKMTQIACAYGMTETSPVSLSTCIEDSVDLRCSTVGRVMPHLEVKIVSEQGAVLPLNSVGEVLVKGYSVMLGYWNNADKTRESIVDGFMKTGDLASCDDRGFFRIVGRSKDMIIRGGENVFPTEVESFLLTMPGVKDAAVIGVPDARLGEECRKT